MRGAGHVSAGLVKILKNNALFFFYLIRTQETLLRKRTAKVLAKTIMVKSSFFFSFLFIPNFHSPCRIVTSVQKKKEKPMVTNS